MKELDHVLDRFVTRNAANLDEAQAALFETLLEMEDDRLWSCLFRQQSTQDKAMDSLIEQIRKSARN